MNNLFVLHTQYNLIIASGLCLCDFKGDQNDLILFHDFKMADNHKMCIDKTFRKSMILEGNFPHKDESYLEKNKRIRTQNARIFEFISASRYDRIFIIEDMCIQEMFAMKCVLEQNSHVSMAWLEDGSNAYFVNSTISEGMGKTPFRRFIRKLFFCTQYGLWKTYYLGEFMGSNPLLKNVYVTFPKNVRQGFGDREIHEISQAAFQKGMEVLFQTERIPFEENSIMIVMDKLDVYGDLLKKVNNHVAEIVETAKKGGKQVYYKYHPRETDNLSSLQGAVELERTIAFESYLTNASTKAITVVGFKSTALQTAKKMGYPTISYIRQVEPDNISILDFYNAIGIACK